jgi:hypothetical protein
MLWLHGESPHFVNPGKVRQGLSLGVLWLFDRQHALID